VRNTVGGIQVLIFLWRILRGPLGDGHPRFRRRGFCLEFVGLGCFWACRALTIASAFCWKSQRSVTVSADHSDTLVVRKCPARRSAAQSGRGGARSRPPSADSLQTEVWAISVRLSIFGTKSDGTPRNPHRRAQNRRSQRLVDPGTELETNRCTSVLAVRPRAEGERGTDARRGDTRRARLVCSRAEGEAMTAQEWLAKTEARFLLDHVRDLIATETSPLAAACCRRRLHRLPDSYAGPK